MPTSVAINLQAAVDTNSHIIVAHEVINLGHDRTPLAKMSQQARAPTGTDALSVLADRGYFSRPQILACEAAGITPICPKPLTPGAKADGRWGNQDFLYQPDTDTYQCPAGVTMTRRFSNIEHGMTLHPYATPDRRCRPSAAKP